MWHTKKQLTISKRSLIILSFLYLLLQTGLFLQGWFSPLIANGLIIATLAALYGYTMTSGRLDASDQWIMNGTDITCSLLAVLVLATILIVGGMIGGFPSHADFLYFRQALYLNLIHAPWPLVLPNGKEMSYYLAAMLPPAMLARILPTGWQQMPLLLNTLFPLTLTLLLFWQGRKKTSLLFLFMLLCFSDPLRLPFHPRTEPFLEPLFAQLEKISGLDVRILTSWYASRTLIAPTITSIGMYNSFPSTLLVAAMLPHLRQSRGLIPLCIALLVPISPLGAIACMPIALWALAPGKEQIYNCRSLCILLLFSLLSLLLVAATAVYFLRADSDVNVVATAWQVKGHSFWIFYLRYFAGALLLILPLWPTRKRDNLYRVTALSAFLLPLLYIGSVKLSPGIWGFNELTLKGAIVYTLILGGMWCDDWKRLGSIRWLMVFWMIIVTGIYLKKQVTSFDIHHPVEDMWNGHLCHDRLFLKQSIPNVKAPLIPGVILRKSGESEEHFPGSILPKADGKVPYGTPPSPHALP